MRLLSSNRGKWGIISTILLFTLLLSACGSANTGSSDQSANSSKKPGQGCTHIGVSLPETSTSPRWDAFDRPMLQSAIASKLSGAKIEYANAEGNANEQQTQVESMLTKGVCILVVAPNNNDAAASIVAKAKQQNVPVISYDRLITSKDVNYYVSFDPVAVGKTQGQYIVDHYKNYVSNGHNNLVMINGSQDDSNAGYFRQGAQESLKPLVDNKTLNLKYDQFTPKWNASDAQKEFEGALTSNSNNISVAYVANDTMAHAVIAALKARNLNGKVLVTGQDATVTGLQDILHGDLNMTVFKPYKLEADATAELVAALSKGNATDSLVTSKTTVPNLGAQIPSILETPIAIDKSNIKMVIDQGYVTKADLCNGLSATESAGIC